MQGSHSWEGGKRSPVRLESLESLLSPSSLLISDYSPHPANFTFKMTLISTSPHIGPVEHCGYFSCDYEPPCWSLRLRLPATEIYLTSASWYTFRSTLPTESLRWLKIYIYIYIQWFSTAFQMKNKYPFLAVKAHQDRTSLLPATSSRDKTGKMQFLNKPQVIRDLPQ